MLATELIATLQQLIDEFEDHDVLDADDYQVTGASLEYWHGTTDETSGNVIQLEVLK